MQFTNSLRMSHRWETGFKNATLVYVKWETSDSDTA